MKIQHTPRNRETHISSIAEKETNARLIAAAAPDLLEALELAYHDLRCIEASSKPNSPEEMRATRNAEKIRSAIAKARGI